MASTVPGPLGNNTSVQRARPERLRASRADIDYRKLHRGPSATERNEMQSIDVTESTGTESTTKPETTKSKDQASATLNTILQAVKAIEGGLIAAEVRAVRAEERTSKAEERAAKAEDKVEEILQRLSDTTIQLEELHGLVTTLQSEMANIQIATSPSPSYADIARTAPNSQPSNLRTLSSMNTTPSTMTDTLYCTVDTSRVEEEDKSKAEPAFIRQAIEREMRTRIDQDNWRCTAVIRDPRNMARIRVTCRNENELQLVKEAAQKIATPGARVLRDQLYPVKIDNANRTAILDQEGALRPEAAEVLGKENEVHIAKMAWLSRKDTGKAYGSMVVYVTKGSDAVRLIQGQYFHVAGESAYTRIYESRPGTTQCFKCQEIGHKAFSCKKAQTCGKCAQVGHHHSDCGADIAKCIPCGGPHESFSKSCRVLYPTHHA